MFGPHTERLKIASHKTLGHVLLPAKHPNNAGISKAEAADLAVFMGSDRGLF